MVEVVVGRMGGLKEGWESSSWLYIHMILACRYIYH